MKLTQIRNATVKIEYAGKKILIDPMLADKGAFPGFQGTMNSHLSNPLVELPLAISEIIDVDAIIITHTHPDHWDEAASQCVPKNMLIFVQHEQDAAILQQQGFKNIRVLSDCTDYDGILLSKTSGQHGDDNVMSLLGDRLGEVCGVVFKHPDEKTLYLAGDTIWNQYVADNLQRYQPEIIILNCGDAQFIGLGSIIMNKEDVYRVHQAAPQATIIASHMEALNHCLLTRTQLSEFAHQKAMDKQLLIPDDGQCYQF